MLMLAPTSAMNLAFLRWASFAFTPGTDKYYQITQPSFTIHTVTTNNPGNNAQPDELTFAITGGAVAPAWMKAGVGVKIAGTLTVGGQTLVEKYVVKSVASDGKSFKVSYNSRMGISKTLVAAAITTGSCTLLIQAQKAMISNPSTNAGNITITDGADAAGANPVWTYVLIPGQDYEVTVQPGSKFDLQDWWAKAANSNEGLNIRFI